MTRTGWLVVVVVLLVLIGGFLLWSNNASAPAVDTGTSADATSGEMLGQSVSDSNAIDGDADDNGAVGASVSATVGSAPMSASVTYNGTSFSPKTVTIAKGGTVTFTDTAGATMWVAADEHPTHMSYDGTDRATHCASGYTGEKPFDQCAKGSTYSFVFKKAGTFVYHDHANASANGTVIVQ